MASERSGGLVCEGQTKRVVPGLVPTCSRFLKLCFVQGLSLVAGLVPLGSVRAYLGYEFQKIVVSHERGRKKCLVPDLAPLASSWSKF